jgi:ABC-type multidrug transport system ATPase subunit
MTVLLTTHYMNGAQFLAGRVAVISAGRIVAEGTLATLGDREQAKARIRYRPPAGATPPDGLSAPWVPMVTPRSRPITLSRRCTSSPGGHSITRPAWTGCR